GALGAGAHGSTRNRCRTARSRAGGTATLGPEALRPRSRALFYLVLAFCECATSQRGRMPDPVRPARVMRVIVALDKFKDALSAERACAVVERELRRMHPDWSIDLCPLSDGGEGFGRLLTDAAQGSRIEVPAKGPRLEPRYGSIGWVATSHLPARARTLLARHVPLGERIGVLEMAEVNGLALLSPDARDALWTSTYGTGELLRAASWLGAELLVLGIGGSATSDLGFGALAALG